MLKKIIICSLVIIMVVLLSFNTSNKTSAAGTYNDIQNHWAQNEITSLSVSGYISGYPDGSFQPDNYISRAEFISTLLACLQLKPAGTYLYQFTNNDHRNQVYIDEAISQGIIIPTEYPSGFEPNKNITRGETAAMIVRALGKQPDYSIMLFTDWNEIKKNSYQGYIKVAYDEGIISGYENGEFRPDDYVTRAQTCKILSCFLQKAYNNSSYSRNNSLSYTPITGKTITTLTLGDHKYNPDYVELYIDSRDSGYYLSDAVIINEYTLKIGAKKYDLEDNRISVLLQNEFYNVKKVINRNNKNDLQLQKTSGYWDNITMSDIYAIYTGSKKLDLDNISKVQFLINNKRYSLSEITIDISGYIKVNRTGYSFSRVKLIAGGKYYDLDNVRVRNGKLVFYCDSSSGISSTRVKINNSYYYTNEVEIVKSGHYYSIEDVVVVRHNVIRIDGHDYSLNSTIKCYHNSHIYEIDSIDYDDDNDRIIIKTSDYDEDISYIYPDEFLFYEDSTLHSSWRTSDIDILINGYWRDWDDIEIIDEDTFEYSNKSYDFLYKDIRRNSSEFEITNTDWNSTTEEFKIYLEENSNNRYIEPREFGFYEDGYSYPWEIDELELYIDSKWRDFEDIKVIDEDYYEYNNKTYRFRYSHLRRYYYEFEITGTYWDIGPRELEITVEEI